MSTSHASSSHQLIDKATLIKQGAEAVGPSPLYTLQPADRNYAESLPSPFSIPSTFHVLAAILLLLLLVFYSAHSTHPTSTDYPEIPFSETIPSSNARQPINQISALLRG